MILTTEGLSSEKEPHPIHQRIAAHHGSQCGFCTPGFVMALFTKLLTSPDCNVQDIVESIESNLCRCTGYRPIVEAAMSMVSDEPAKPSAVGEREWGKIRVVYPFPFPDELKVQKLPSLRIHVPRPLPGRATDVFRPATFHELLEITSEHPDATIAAGFSEILVNRKVRGSEPKKIISVWRIPELLAVSENEGGFKIGAGVTVANLKKFLKHFPESARAKSIMARIFRFASPQVRSNAAVGGNVCHASPVSDLLPIMMSADALFVLQSLSGTRVVPARAFVKGYLRVDIQPGEVLKEIVIPPPPACDFYAMSYKLTRRFDDDISVVGAAFELGVTDGVISRARAAFASMAATTRVIGSLEAFLEGKPFDTATIYKGMDLLAKELKLPEDVPGGMADYRSAMSPTLFFRFAVDAANNFSPELARKIARVGPTEDIASIAADQVPHGLKKSAQIWDDIEMPQGVLHKPMQHSAATVQARGKADYTTATALPPGSLYAYPIFANVVRGFFVALDSTRLMESIPGAKLVTANDIPEGGFNGVGVSVKDERVLVPIGTEIYAPSEVLALVLADSEEKAQLGARIVREDATIETTTGVVSFDDLFALDDEAREERLICEKRLDHYPDAEIFEEAFRTAAHVVESETTTGPQEHFYFETHAAVASVTELDNLRVRITTQNPAACQGNIAAFLGLSEASVEIEAPRLGGGFGGKESTFVYCSLAALATMMFDKTVFLRLTRDDDVKFSGKRHPLKIFHRIASDENGSILAMDVQITALGGFTTDLTPAVMERAVFHAFGSYKIPLCRIIGRAYATNAPSNTAFRGFGAPQTILAAEVAMDVLAEKTGIDPDDLRERNLLRSGDMMPFHSPIGGVTLGRVWKSVMKSAEISSRKRQIRQFNATHTYRKRGLAFFPVTFGVTFTQKFLNQANALVHLHKDGSLLVSHCGIEMGQGVDTKLAALAADELGIEIEKVKVARTTTLTCPNGPPTSASSATDLNGYAIADACRKLKQNLAPILAEREAEGLTWAQVATRAWFMRRPLTATGYYASPVAGFNFEDQTGVPFAYFSFSLAAVEVEVDVLTGTFVNLRSDVCVDVGRSLNPALDVGQVEGAFIQGIGFSTEEFLYLRSLPFSSGPGNYKIPSPLDVPQEFNITLLPNSRNPRAPHSSKGVGEPPFCLGGSIFVAARRAIAAARKQRGLSTEFELRHPLTMESVRACVPDWTGGDAPSPSQE
eukprot:gnl/Chilomastix_cuspidata/329.p1 GENE.gnl/Chilomastix_cuspidata/329~~gnl/Chilomastix_cuspidata/329.p1  ORF type:complete len:1313 (+),score=142.08 gnl/Chilomastix_cuspidata/329:268-3939(+)